MRLIIFGAPGVGKGTQAKILAGKLNIAHISTGDILRNAIKNGTEVGLKAKEIINRGELVPDDVMGEIVKETLQKDSTKNGYILDGFPRTIEQAKILTNILKGLKQDQPTLLILDSDDQIIVDRLSQRRVCTSCGFIVNLNDFQGDTCPNCGNKNTFVKRDDDNEEVITKRLKIYHEATQPVVDYYQDKTKTIKIDGTREIEAITEDIMKQLKVS